MTKKEVKKIALLSFADSDIDVRKVKRFTQTMNRRELRQYVRFLKLIDSQKKIKILTPIKEDLDLKNRISRIFPKKRIIFEEDPSILLGIRIINNDILYDFNLENEFEELKKFVA